jgi:hypothetical protein
MLDLASKVQTSWWDKITGSATWTRQLAEPGREDETWKHGTRAGFKWRKDVHYNPELADEDVQGCQMAGVVWTPPLFKGALKRLHDEGSVSFQVVASFGMYQGS